MTTKPTYELTDDACVWCKHEIKVAVRTWETVKSHQSMPICANYCNDKTCKIEGCEHKCEEAALGTPENTEKVLHEVVRRRRKLERLAAEAEAELVAANKTDE